MKKRPLARVRSLVCNVFERTREFVVGVLVSIDVNFAESEIDGLYMIVPSPSSYLNPLLRPLVVFFLLFSDVVAMSVEWVEAPPELLLLLNLL
jgi:hypothetical protein